MPVRRLYRLILHAYNRAYRRDLGRDMEETFVDRYRAVRQRGALPAARFTVRAFWDVIVNAVLERIDHRRPPNHKQAVPSTSPQRRGDSMLSSVWQDVRFGARTLGKSPMFTGIAVLTLALGIGATTAIFSGVNGVLLRPLPYESPDQLTYVQVNSGIAGGPTWYGTSEPEFHDLGSLVESFETVAAYSSGTFTVGDSTAVRRVRLMRSTASLLPMLGVPPLLGRTFTPEEDQPNGPRGLVLSYGMWQRDFGGDPDVLGRTLDIQGFPIPIVGVMPAGFEFPGLQWEAWGPLGLNVEDPWARNNHYLNALARLKPGVTRQAAQNEVDLLASRSTTDFPEFYPDPGYRIRLQSYHTRLVGDVAVPLYILMGAVGFVLLTACVNVANLLLARGEARKREMAIRTAMGASGARVARQLLTENFLLAASGGFAGIGVAFLGVKLLLAIVPDGLPRLNQIGIDGVVLGFSLLLVVGTGFLFGVIPALQATKPNLHETLKEGGHSHGGAKSGHALRRTLVVVQMALAVVLVAGAGIMLRSVLNMYRVDTGFTTENVLTLRLSPSSNKYNTSELRVAFYRGLLEQANALPGVAAAGAVGSLPLFGGTSNWSIVLEGQPVATVANAPAARVQQATPEYFDALGFTLLRGRLFTWDDVANSTGVVVINEAMARAHWPDEDPIGKRMRVFAGDPPWMEVIGVVKDVRYQAVNRDPEPRWYVPHAQGYRTAYVSPLGMTLVVRTTSDPNALVGPIRGLMASFDNSVPISQVQTMEQVFAVSVERERFVSTMLAAFGLLALFLAAVGVYGVISYAVSQRTHEIGLRMALGASGGNVLGQVVREGLVLSLIGVGVGLAGSILVSRAFESLVFGITPTDPLTYVGVIVVLTAVAAGASLIPARRASRVSPMVALREQ